MMTDFKLDAQSASCFSDLFKDVTGSRPRGYTFRSLEEYNSEMDYLQEQLISQQNHEKNADIQLLKLYEAHINKLMVGSNVDRATAVRWDMQAMDCDGDIEHYFYLWGFNNFLTMTRQYLEQNK